MIRSGRSLRVFLDGLAKTLSSADTVLDIGTSQRFAKELRPVESLFAGKKYVAAGYQPARNYGVYNCDDHQDIEGMTYTDASFDAVICLEVLEHVANPFQAVAEIKRVLRPGGRLLLTAPFLGGYHGKGEASASHDQYPDYWRFTHQGLQFLFSDFGQLEVHAVDGPIEFRLKQLRLGEVIDHWPLRQLVDALDCPKLGKAATRHLLVGMK